MANERTALDKRKFLKIGKWVLVIRNQDQYRQAKHVAMILEEEKEGEIKLVYRTRHDNQTTDFFVGKFMVEELVPLHNCTGWDYQP